MKNTITTILIIMFVFSFQLNAEARDKDWAIAGKILTGVIGIGIIADAINDCSQPSGTYQSHRNRSHCSRAERVWIDGHYETYKKDVWVEGDAVRVWKNPGYSTEYRHGRKIRIYHEGYYYYKTLPGHYETRVCRRWVDGYWA